MYLRVGALGPDRLPLLVARCDGLDLAPGPEGYRATPFEATRDLFAGCLDDTIPGPWTYGIVVGLAPGAQLAAHVDGPIRGVRKHVVLQTNPGCWVFHGGDWQQLDPGGIYVMDPTVVHGAVNWGEQPRLHLVIDT